MGKRRKAIRWLVAIVIVALIGGVTAVAVDRRIREQVEEEYLDRVMEMGGIEKHCRLQEKLNTVGME